SDAVFALIVHVFASSIRAVCQLEHLRIQIYTIYTFYTAIKEGFATASVFQVARQGGKCTTAIMYDIISALWRVN
ncbi:MAG: hypothetical protein K6G91_07765, partial [Kiritimatiellae bacterium]|nr:hypothetical protein [Kiritimatiellia bacterium]